MFAEFAPQYRSLGLYPIPAEGKAPVPAGATGRGGVVTDEKIAEWSSDPRWATQNVALRAEGYIAIDVDAYDDKVGDQTIAELEAKLGELPVTISSTSRGLDSPSRQYFYRVPDDMEFVSNLKDVEIVQKSHRYSIVHPSIHPETNQRYVWYGYDGEPLEDLPAIDDLEWLPEAWLEFLSKPVGTTVDYAPFGGTVDEWLARCNPGEPEPYVREIVNGIPKEDFGHDVLIQLQATLVGLGADNRAGIPWALSRLREEWLRDPYNTPEFERDWNLSLNGAIAKFGNFEEDILADLLAPKEPEAPAQPEEPFDALDAAITLGDEFLQFWAGLPETINPITLLDRVRQVRDKAMQAGYGIGEACQVALGSGARLHAQCPQLTADEIGALSEDDEPAAEPDDPEPAKEVERRPVRLLTTREGAALEGVRWWGDEFMERMAEVNPVMSEQYYRLNRWIILSLIFAHKAIIPASNGTPILLNFYAIVLGPSGTGKSESLNPIKGMMSAFYVADDTPDIGGNATEQGLTRALIKRDGKTSFFHSDEADAVLLAWSDKLSAFAGMKQRITDVFGGDVPAMQRATAQDISGIHAKAYMCAHLTGIDERIADAIDPHDWESGFINRFIWAKGERKQKTREQEKFPLRRADDTAKRGDVNAWYAQWAAQFRRITETTLATTNPDEPVWLDIADDVIDRDVETVETFEKMARKSMYPERLRPTFTRMRTTILKCAALVAITERRKRIEMQDYLIALEQAEEWVATALEMVEATDESPRARQANRLANLIAQHGGQMRSGDIHSRKGYAGSSRDTNDLIRELVEQGRVEVLPIGKSSANAIVRLINEKGELAA